MSMYDAVCRECGADIIWARTATGKRQPIDPERRDRGDTTATLGVVRDHLGQLRVRVVTDTEPLKQWEWRGMPHQATCRIRIEQRKAQLRADGVIPFRRKGA